MFVLLALLRAPAAAQRQMQGSGVPHRPIDNYCLRIQFGGKLMIVATAKQIEHIMGHIKIETRCQNSSGMWMVFQNMFWKYVILKHDQSIPWNAGAVCKVQGQVTSQVPNHFPCSLTRAQQLRITKPIVN